MRTIPAPLQSHLDSGATTLCYCWRITRSDAVVMGFTEHDRDLVFDGTTFKAATGFQASMIEGSLGLNVDNISVQGALSAASITEDDLAAGRYDDARVELFWVNWQDVSQRVLVLKGSTGEVKRQGILFTAELRGLTHRLNQKTGRLYQRTCDAVFGDGRCALSKASFTYASTITTVLATRTIRANGLSGLATDWLSRGVLTFTSGPNSGRSYDIKEHTKDGSGNVTIELWQPPAFTMSVGEGISCLAGCKQTLAVCRDKFNNVANFQGFPHIPGNDVITRYPSTGGSNQSGGSLFNG